MLLSFESRLFLFAYRGGGALTLGFISLVLSLAQTACTDSTAQFVAASDLGVTIDQPHTGATLTSGTHGAVGLSAASRSADGSSSGLTADNGKLRALLQQAASATLVEFVGRCDYDGQPVALKVAKRPEIKTTCGNLTWSASVDLGPEPDGPVTANAQHWDTSGKMSQTTISLRKHFHPSLQESATLSAPVPAAITSTGTAVFNISINPGVDPSTVDLSVSKISVVYAAGGDASCKSVTLKPLNSGYSVLVSGCTGNGSLTVSLTSGTPNGGTAPVDTNAHLDVLGPSPALLVGNTPPQAPQGLTVANIGQSLTATPGVTFTLGAPGSAFATISEVDVQVLNASDQSIVLDWQPGPPTAQTLKQYTGLNLLTNKQYILLVREIDNFGNTSPSASATWSNNLVPIVVANLTGGRNWSDGTLATECDGYIHPKDPGYVYSGATGDGVYTVDPTGSGNSSSGINVTCNMTEDTGGWTLLDPAVSASLINTGSQTRNYLMYETAGHWWRSPLTTLAWNWNAIPQGSINYQVTGVYTPSIGSPITCVGSTNELPVLGVGCSNGKGPTYKMAALANPNDTFVSDPGTAKATVANDPRNTLTFNAGAYTRAQIFVRSGSAVGPTNLVLTQTPNWKTFTVNWTAGSGNGGPGGCKLQYQNAAGAWLSVASPASVNCDSAGNSVGNNVGAITLPGDGWYGANWSSVPLRLMRNSDSSTAASFNSALKCSALPASLTATPNIDENCDNLWDNSGTAVTQSYNNPSGISVPLNPGAHFSVPASYGGCPYVKIQWLKAFENYSATSNGSCGGPASSQWPTTWGSNGWTSPGTPASLVVASGLDSPSGTISFPLNGACVGQNALTTQLFGFWDMRALPPYNVWDSYSLVYQCTGTVYY